MFSALRHLADAQTPGLFEQRLQLLKASDDWTSNPLLAKYVEAEWLNCTRLWAAYDRQVNWSCAPS